MHPLYEKADRLSSEVIGAAIEVHRKKGPGLIESIYERCMLRELELRSIPATTQKLVRVEYKALSSMSRCVLTFSWTSACWSS
jgi:GxxExxY protein